MDALTEIALLGTARTGTTTLVDALGDSVNDTPERALLLRAGADAIMRRAGMRPVTAPDPPRPALPETLPICSLGAAALMHELLTGKHPGVAAEAARQMRRVGQRLPPVLLPLALSVHLDINVLGERGRWLAQFTQAGRANLYQSVMLFGDALPADVQTRWREGNAGERRDALRKMREHDPATGRAWLMDDWKREKAEFREQALRQFFHGLSYDDEPFLEAALDDRAESVRNVAIGLLTRLPNSALVQRMIARADPLLTYDRRTGKLQITLPHAYVAEWQRDGITAAQIGERPADNWMGERGWWLAQMLAAIPPDHWTARFEVSAARLIAATASEESGNTVRYGWKRSTVMHKAAGWASLWWQQALTDAPLDTDIWPFVPLWSLCRVVPDEEAAHIAVAALAHTSIDDKRWYLVTEALARPWNRVFANFCLDRIEEQGETSVVESDGSRSWFHTLVKAAEALPPECLPRAAHEWPYREPDDPKLARWHRQRWDQTVPAFKETVRLRARIYEEITP